MNERNQEQQMESNENKRFLEILKSGKINRVFDGKQLDRLDKLAENMDILANGKLGNNKPFSKVLSLPANERSEAIDKTVKKLFNDMDSVRSKLQETPNIYSKKQQEDLKTLFNAISERGRGWRNDFF